MLRMAARKEQAGCVSAHYPAANAHQRQMLTLKRFLPSRHAQHAVSGVHFSAHHPAAFDFIGSGEHQGDRFGVQAMLLF